MVFTVVALAALGYEALAVASGRVPTITTVLRSRPVWQRVLFVAALAGIALDHLVGPILP